MFVDPIYKTVLKIKHLGYDFRGKIKCWHPPSSILLFKKLLNEESLPDYSDKQTTNLP